MVSEHFIAAEGSGRAGGAFLLLLHAVRGFHHEAPQLLRLQRLGLRGRQVEVGLGILLQLTMSRKRPRTRSPGLLRKNRYVGDGQAYSSRVDRMPCLGAASGTHCTIPGWQLLLLLLCLSSMLLFRVPAARADVIADCNQTDNPERAIRACSTYLEDRTATPQNLAVAYVNRAIAYSLRRGFDQALSDYGAAIQLDPENPLAFYNRGNLHFDRGEHAKAIADYTSAIERDPTFALAYLNRGLAHERTGRNEAATADYRQALSKQPTAAQARRRLRQLRSKP